MSKLPTKLHCPCGTGRGIDVCCGRFLDGGEHPDTPEALMRSRYTAHVLRRALYLFGTWHPRTRPATIPIDEATEWLGLTVLGAALDDEDHGTVEFIARHRTDGRTHALHERSRFVKRHATWVYVDGDVF